MKDYVLTKRTVLEAFEDCVFQMGMKKGVAELYNICMTDVYTYVKNVLESDLNIAQMIEHSEEKP